MSQATAARRDRSIRRRRLVALTATLALAGVAVGVSIATAVPGDLSGGPHPAGGGSLTTNGLHHRVPSGRLNEMSRGPVNIYSHTLVGMLTPVTRRALYLVYAPDSQGNGVYVIDPSTFKVIRYIPTGAVVQHVVPAWDLRTLFATNDIGNSLTPINPDTRAVERGRTFR